MASPQLHSVGSECAAGAEPTEGRCRVREIRSDREAAVTARWRRRGRAGGTRSPCHSLDNVDKGSDSGWVLAMRNLPGFSPTRLALVLTVGFFVVVLVVAFLAARPGGNDAQTASNAVSSGGERVKVVIAGTNDALEEQTDGGIAGVGTFRATGAITDRGSVTAYRSVPSKELILLRFSATVRGARSRISSTSTSPDCRRPHDGRSICDEGVRGAARSRQRKRERDLHRQHPEGERVALTRRKLA